MNFLFDCNDDVARHTELWHKITIIRMLQVDCFFLHLFFLFFIRVQRTTHNWNAEKLKKSPEWSTFTSNGHLMISSLNSNSLACELMIISNYRHLDVFTYAQLWWWSIEHWTTRLVSCFLAMTIRFLISHSIYNVPTTQVTLMNCLTVSDNTSTNQIMSQPQNDSIIRSATSDKSSRIIK